MIRHFYIIGLRIDLYQLIECYSELEEIDQNDPTTIDRTSDDGYPYYDQIYFALYSLIHIRARFILPAVQQIFTHIPLRIHIQRPLAETDQPYYLTIYDVLNLQQFPDLFGPVGDPTTKHIRPPPTSTSGQQRSRFSELYFAFSMLRRGNALDRQIVTNGRIVVIGSSDINISILERMIFAKSRFFLSLTLVSPQCLRCLESTIIPPPAFHHHPFVEFYPNEISIIPSVPGNIPATEQPASFINVTPSTHHSLFVIPTPFRPPAPALFVANSCNYNPATLAGLGLQRYIEEVPGAVLNIDLEKRELMFADGSLNYFCVGIADGSITMNDEDDAIRLQTFIHKPTQPRGKKWLEDEDEIAGVPGKKLLFIREPADPDANLMIHETRIDKEEEGIKKKYKDGDNEILKITSLKGDQASFTPFDNNDTQIQLKMRNIYLKLQQGLLIEGMRYQHILKKEDIQI
ncbi:MAG: hypothetical protein EZS28_003523 [Streblomastix strix]|uniref:Uncharacterized protein n=1 Tax=Streblomastix strix TaxID=222440 RepID=A0A5J4X1C2_9EUKA|nr:MAG: hypothetical protein EZS28_003523 [Streblomastix strix]